MTEISRHLFYVLLELGTKADDSPSTPEVQAALVSTWIDGTDGHIGNYANGGDEHCWVESAKTFPTLETLVANVPHFQTLIEATQEAIVAISDYNAGRYGAQTLDEGLWDARHSLLDALKDMGLEYKEPEAETTPMQQAVLEALTLEKFTEWLQTYKPEAQVINLYEHPIIMYLAEWGVHDITVTNVSIDHEDGSSLLGSLSEQSSPNELPLNIVGEWLPALLDQTWGGDADEGIEPTATAQDVLNFLATLPSP